MQVQMLESKLLRVHNQEIQTMKRRDGLRNLGLGLILLMPIASLGSPFRELTITVNSINVYLADLLFVLAAITWTVFTLERGRIWKKGIPVIIYIVMLILLNLTLLLFGISSQWLQLARYVETLLWGLMAITFVSNEYEIKTLAKIITTTGAIIATVSIALHLMHPEYQRIAGFFSAAGPEGLGRQASYNEIGAIHALSILIAFQLIMFGGSKTKTFLWWMGLVLNAAGLMLTQSRSSFLAVTIGVIVIFLVFDKKNRYLFMKQALYFLPVIALLLFNFYDSSAKTSK